MRIRTAVVSATALVVAAAVLAFTPAPAGAQTADPCPPGQPSGRPFGTPPGPPGSPPGQPASRPLQYPPGKCQLRLSRSVVGPGDSVGIAGAGFARSSEVRLAVAGAGLGTVTADQSGAFATDVVIPASVAPGVHEVTASGVAPGGEPQVLAATLTVTGAEASRGGTGSVAGQAAQEGSLPRTGTGDGVRPLSALALALLV
ncbi:MAG: hypothetical protein M3Q48_03530, partial [Actinomycetota bacterium]|nr:hypothetical protein [Actinomycetota bacterium]